MTKETKETTNEEAKEGGAEDKEEAPKTEVPAEPAVPEPADRDGDVSMADVEATKEASTIITEPNPDAPADAAKPDRETTAPAATIS